MSKILIFVVVLFQSTALFASIFFTFLDTA